MSNTLNFMHSLKQAFSYISRNALNQKVKKVTKKDTTQEKIQWKSNSEKKLKKKKEPRNKEEIRSYQGNIDWNKNLIRDFEEKQENNQGSTCGIFFKSKKFKRKVD